MGLVPIHVHLEDFESINNGAFLSDVNANDVELRDVKLENYSHRDCANEAWVPYERRVFSGRLGFADSLSELPALLAHLRTLHADEVAAREAELVAMRDSHFSIAGVLGQIKRFLTAPAATLHFSKRRQRQENQGDSAAAPWRVSAEGSDLVCRQLPRYPTSNHYGKAAGYIKPVPWRDHSTCDQWTSGHDW